MGAFRYILEVNRRKQSDVKRYLQRIRCWKLRQLPAVHRATRPTDSVKARMLGYKAKQGYVVYRVRVSRGGRKKVIRRGLRDRKPKHAGIRKIKSAMNLRSVAEERVGRACTNLRVLNSYWINQDGKYMYFEVLLVDPSHNAIRNDPRINWICSTTMKRREARGLTSAGKKRRGLMLKGHLYNKNRPSRRANWKRRNTVKLWRYR